MDPTPPLLGFSHVSFSCRDLDTCERWYRDVMGLRVLDRPEGHGWREVILGRMDLGLVIGLQEHADRTNEDFDHRRTGLDHFAIGVASREDLEAWREHLAKHGAAHSPIEDRDYGSVLSFRDPDGIALELFAISPAMLAQARAAGNG